MLRQAELGVELVQASVAALGPLAGPLALGAPVALFERPELLALCVLLVALVVYLRRAWFRLQLAPLLELAEFGSHLLLGEPAVPCQALGFPSPGCRLALPLVRLELRCAGQVPLALPALPGCRLDLLLVFLEARVVGS